MASGRVPFLHVALLGLLLVPARAPGQEVIWATESGGPFGAGPAIGADGTIYACATAGGVYAFSPTGARKWVFWADAGGYLVGPALAADGTIYVAAGGTLYAVSADGRGKWELKTDAYGASDPAVGRDGTVYLATWDGELHAVSADGRREWTFQAKETVVAPVVGGDGTIYLVGAGRLHAISPEGTTRWTFEASLSAAPAIGGDGTIYAGSSDGRLYAISPEGRKKWALPTRAGQCWGPVIGEDGTIYVGASDGRLYAVSAEGSERWTFQTGDTDLYTPAVGADGTVFIGSCSPKTFHAVDAAGRELWSLPVWMQSSPAIGADGTIYVAADWKLCALRSDCGGLARSPWPMQRRAACRDAAAGGPAETLVSRPSPGRAPALALVSVESGTFLMGSGSGDTDERPVHAVTVSSFLMATYETTQADYESVMGANPSQFSGEGPGSRPVEQVSWFEAVAFCNELSKLQGLERCYTIDGTKVSCDFTRNGYRLPTEAEWEYAARGGTLGRGRTYAGSDSAADVAWCGDNAGGTTHPVGAKAPNELGLYDMSGNVWEWCWDWYGQYQSGMQSDPSGPSSGTERTARGGSWFYRSVYAETSHRGNVEPAGKYNGIGFRVARRGG